ATMHTMLGYTSARCIRSAARYVLACPRWVASYGVIPQTYSRAVPGVSGVTGATRPVRVSCRRSGRPEAGKGESEGEVQERTIRSYGPNRTSGAGQRVDHTTHQQAQQHQPGDDPVHHEDQVGAGLDQAHEPDD